MTQFNFSCDTAYPKETLATLRTRLLRRLGYSAQAANPPPGMTELLNDFLQEAQRMLHSGAHAALFRNKRWFTWPLVQGERFYGFTDNTEDPACSKTLNPEMIEWVGVCDDDDTNWLPLSRGIKPTLYSQMEEGWPTHYEIGQGIELWPPPGDDMRKLRIYGNFDLLPFTADGDYTTIDPDAIFLHALGTAKAHYKQQDASVAIDKMHNRIGELVAATHNQRRYIPRDMVAFCNNNHHNPGIFGSTGIRYLEDGSVRIVEEA